MWVFLGFTAGMCLLIVLWATGLAVDAAGVFALAILGIGVLAQMVDSRGRAPRRANKSFRVTGGRGALRSRTMPLLVAGLLLASRRPGLAACGDDSGGGSETSLDLTIGNLVPLTGDLSAFGPPGQKAADLAVKQIQSAAKEAGANHNVEIAHGDDGSNSQAGVKAARKLVDAENASCLAGGWGSPTTIPVARSVAISDQVLMISPASTEDAVTDLKDNGFVNRTSPPDRFQGPALANVVEEALGGAQGKTVNIGARAIPTAPASPTRSARRGKGRAAGSGNG